MGLLGRTRLVPANLAGLKLAPAAGGDRARGCLTLVLVSLVFVVISGCGLTGASSPKSTSNAQLQVTTTALPGGHAGAAYQAALAATGGMTPYSWSVVLGALPPGLSLAAATGQITGTPSSAGTSSFTVQVNDAAGRSATQGLSIAISPSGPAPLTIATTSLPGGAQNSAYSATLAASGGTQPYGWSVVSGALPVGLSLTSATGVISGTPTTLGVSTFTVQVNDAGGQMASQAFTLTIASSISANILAAGFETAADRACPPVFATDHISCVNPGTWSGVSDNPPAPVPTYINDPTGAHSGQWYASMMISPPGQSSAGWFFTVPSAHASDQVIYMKEWLKYPTSWRWQCCGGGNEQKAFILESGIANGIRPIVSLQGSAGCSDVNNAATCALIYVWSGNGLGYVGPGSMVINADGLWHSLQLGVDTVTGDWKVWLDGQLDVEIPAATRSSYQGPVNWTSGKYGHFFDMPCPSGATCSYNIDDIGLSTVCITSPGTDGCP